MAFLQGFDEVAAFDTSIETHDRLSAVPPDYPRPVYEESGLGQKVPFVPFAIRHKYFTKRPYLR